MSVWNESLPWVLLSVSLPCAYHRKPGSKKRNPTDQMNVFVEPGQVMDDFSRAIFSERDSMSTVELHEI